MQRKKRPISLEIIITLSPFAVMSITRMKPHYDLGRAGFQDGAGAEI